MPTQYKQDVRKDKFKNTVDKLGSLFKKKPKVQNTNTVDPNYTSPGNKSGMSDADYARMYS